MNFLLALVLMSIVGFFGFQLGRADRQINRSHIAATSYQDGQKQAQKDYILGFRTPDEILELDRGNCFMPTPEFIEGVGAMVVERLGKHEMIIVKREDNYYEVPEDGS